MNVNDIIAFVVVRFCDEVTGYEDFNIYAVYDDHGYCNHYGLLRASRITDISDDFNTVSLDGGLWSVEEFQYDDEYEILWRGESIREAYLFFKSVSSTKIAVA